MVKLALLLGKEEFAEIMGNLKLNGVTIIMVSHDIEFCAEYADSCAMFFDGNTLVGMPAHRARNELQQPIR